MRVLVFLPLLIASAAACAQADPRQQQAAQEQALRRFGEATHLSGYVETLTEPLWTQVIERLDVANPGRKDDVRATVRTERAKYVSLILDVGPSMAAMKAQSAGSIDQLAGIARAQEYAARPAATDFAKIPPEQTICLIQELNVPELNRPECADVNRLIVATRKSGNQDRIAYLDAFGIVRLGALAAIQMSLDSGDPLALVDRKRIEAAGLRWPEKSASTP